MTTRPFIPSPIERLLRVLLQHSIQLGARVRGRKVDERTSWAAGFTGTEHIGAGIYQR